MFWNPFSQFFKNNFIKTKEKRKNIFPKRFYSRNKNKRGSREYILWRFIWEIYQKEFLSVFFQKILQKTHFTKNDDFCDGCICDVTHFSICHSFPYMSLISIYVTHFHIINNTTCWVI